MIGSGTERLDAVQIKITLAGSDVDRVRTGFHLNANQARRFRLYFCELPAQGRRLALLDAGLILRMRAHSEGRDDATVTLRPCRRERLGPRWIGLRKTREHEFRIEGDWSSTGHILTASLITTLPGSSIAGALAHPGEHAGMFSPLQREFITDCADLHPSFTDLEMFGPVHTLHWTVDTDHLAVAIERWTIPATDIDLLELRVHAAPADAPLIRPALVALVRRHGLDPDFVTTTKTRTVLSHLTARHP